MALTNEILSNNQALSGLSDEQRAAIVELSKNDEAAVIGQRVGEIYGGLDADILSASGIPKNGIEKTYEYAKRVIGEIKGQVGNATELQNQITELTNEKNRLQGIIDKGGSDDETKRQLTQARAELENVQKQYSELKTSFDTEKAAHEKALFDVRLDNEFATASAGLKFKPELPESARGVLLQQRIRFHHQFRQLRFYFFIKMLIPEHTGSSYYIVRFFRPSRAAPMIPASLPSCALAMCVILSWLQGIVSRATCRCIGCSRYSSASLLTPPPMAKVSGWKMLTRLTMPVER